MKIPSQALRDAPRMFGFARRQGVLLVAALIVGCLIGASPTAASHTIITSTDWTYSPYGAANEEMVYLSAPRHTSSGNRGELGWEENINGRHWNFYAATGDYMLGSPSTSLYRNLRTRGYYVRVSANARDGGYMDNLNASNNWGATVHITTHTNAGGGNYMLIMVDNDTATAMDRELQTQMDLRVGSVVPGTEVLATDGGPYTNGINLAELSAAADSTVYVELIFHDNQSHVDWLGSGSDWGASVKYHAWRYGYAVDVALGYP